MFLNYSTVRKLVKGSVFILSVLMFFSCENFLNHTEKESGTSNDKTYLSINLKKAASVRTVYPEAIDIDSLKNFKLSGIPEAGSTEVELASATLKEDFPEKVEVTPGKWIFTLSAELFDAATGTTISYSDTVTININRGTSNNVSFELKPQLSGNGGFEITINLTPSSRLDKVRATLTTLDGNIIETKYLEIPTPTNPDDPVEVTYSKNNISDENESLEPGSYHLLIEFLAAKVSNASESSADDWLIVNQWESYVCVVSQKISMTNLSLNFNELFTITYKNSEGGTVTDFREGLAVTKYSRGSSFSLPRPNIPGKVFLGWKKEGTSELITEIQSSDHTDFILIAETTDPILYVSGTGDETNSGFTETEALESIDKACEKIIQYGSSGLNWTIKIDGDVTGPHSSNKKAGNRTSTNDYGRSIIPEPLTSDYANSITLIGKNSLDSNGMPQDKINRGLNGHGQYGNEEGVNLVVATSVPVTINNLLLTNGNNAYPNNSSVTYVYTGGGLLVTSNATVTLGDGVIIKENRAVLGGGVYNAGTLFIHGTALIGDRSVSTVSTGYGSGQCSNSTSGDGGAGIYNSGKLYLGYSDENTPADWDTEKGGIYYNYAYWNSAGAIYNSLSGEVFFKSGIIQYNCGQFAGGAIYNLGTFKMEGGTIENNHAGSTGGGGIYNANINGKGPGTFIMSGGSINSNTTTSNGGGIFSAGTVYLYGSAVIGNADATSAATSDTNCSNYAESNGGGMYLSGDGKCYIGYSSFTSAKVNTIAIWSGGIYYNYSTKGGGIWVHSSDSIKTGLYINSGKIKNNGVTSNGLGGAIYLEGNNFSLGGSAEIPPGSDNKQDIYILSSTSSFVLNAPITTTEKPYLSLRQYSDSQALLVRAEGLTSDDVSITTEAEKFTIPDQENANLEAPIEWIIQEKADGKGYLTPKLPQATPSNNEIKIDIGYNTVDLDMRLEGTYSAYSQSGSVYTLKDTSKAFKIYLYNSGNYQDYVWLLEGEQISTADNIIFGGTSGLNLSSWAKGNYDLSFECTRKEDHLKYSYSVQIKIQ